MAVQCGERGRVCGPARGHDVRVVVDRLAPYDDELAAGAGGPRGSLDPTGHSAPPAFVETAPDQARAEVGRAAAGCTVPAKFETEVAIDRDRLVDRGVSCALVEPRIHDLVETAGLDTRRDDLQPTRTLDHAQVGQPRKRPARRDDDFVQRIDQGALAITRNDLLGVMQALRRSEASHPDASRSSAAMMMPPASVLLVLRARVSTTRHGSARPNR